MQSWINPVLEDVKEWFMFCLNMVCDLMCPNAVFGCVYVTDNKTDPDEVWRSRGLHPVQVTADILLIC